jgi:hypothetical protein
MISLWCIGLGTALATVSTRDLKPLQLVPLIASGALVAGYVVLAYEQTTVHSWTSVTSSPIWAEAGKLLGIDFAPSVSVVRNEPFWTLGAPLVALSTLSLSSIVCLDPVRSRRLLRVIAWSSTFYAILGIVLFILDPTKVLWRDKAAYMEVLTGPFINRNTAAVYFGSCACVSAVLLFEELRPYRDRGRHQIMQVFLAMERQGQWRVSRLAFFVVILVAAMLMTASRAGVVISFLGLVVAFAAFWWRRLSHNRILMPSALVAGVVVILILQLFGGGVGARFNESGVTDTIRFDTYQSTLHMIVDHPVLGTGLGTFSWAFPYYRDASSIWGVVDRAHNTLLEIAAEDGIPFAAGIVLAWVCAMSMLVRGVRIRHRGLATPVAATSVATIGLLHSMVDFSLQIPGYAIVVFSLVGAGIAQSSGSRRSKPPTVE